MSWLALLSRFSSANRRERELHNCKGKGEVYFTFKADSQDTLGKKVTATAATLQEFAATTEARTFLSQRKLDARLVERNIEIVHQRPLSPPCAPCRSFLHLEQPNITAHAFTADIVSREQHYAENNVRSTQNGNPPLDEVTKDIIFQHCQTNKNKTK